MSPPASPVRSFVTTHVLDAAGGAPAAGIGVELSRGTDDDAWETVARAVTDDDGRVGDLGPAALPSGTYRLAFAVGAWFAARGERAFYPEVVLTVELDAEQDHYHLPILLSPFAYTTYRGS